MGNQLTKEKVLEINSLDALPYESPEPLAAEEIEVIDQEDVSSTETKLTKEGEGTSKPDSNDKEPPIDDEGQTLLF
jgi:topoisomerase-4 subunit A